MSAPLRHSPSPRTVAIVGTYVDGWGSKAVARAFGITDDAVKARVASLAGWYRATGRFAGTKIALAARMREDGHNVG